MTHMKITCLSLLCAVICLTASAQNEKKYLVHSSTNVIGCNTENRAVLMSPTSSSILPLTLIPQSDGTTVLALEGTTTLYLSLHHRRLGNCRYICVCHHLPPFIII